MAFERVMPGLSCSMPPVMRTWPPKPNAMRFLRSFYATWLCKDFCFRLRFFVRQAGQDRRCSDCHRLFDICNFLPQRIWAHTKYRCPSTDIKHHLTQL